MMLSDPSGLATTSGDILRPNLTAYAYMIQASFVDQLTSPPLIYFIISARPHSLLAFFMMQYFAQLKFGLRAQFH